MFGEPGSPFGFDFEQGHKELLAKLLSQAQVFFHILVFEETPYDYEFKFIGNAQYDIQSAYGGPEGEYVTPLFEECQHAIKASDDAKFEATGLTGPMLKAKLSLLVYWGDLFIGGVWGAIKYIFKQLNALFGSIQTATGFGEVIKELKDLIANGINYIDKPA